MFECVFVGESESIVLFIALHCLFHEFFMNWSRVQCLGKAAFVLFIVKSPVSYRKKIVSTLLMFLHLVYCLFKELYFFVAFFFFGEYNMCSTRDASSYSVMPVSSLLFIWTIVANGDTYVTSAT